MPKPLFVFAHGAGLPSTSPWMKRWAGHLERIGKVVGFDYPYMAAGRRAPDKLPKLIEAHRTALAGARKGHRGPVVLVGKSMGSRVGCHLSLEEKVDALVCLGYPLKGMGKTGKIRDAVLVDLRTPILFVQGTRDNLCPLDLLAKVRKKMTAPSELYIVQAGNHSLDVTKTQLKVDAETSADVEGRVLDAIRDFVTKVA